MSKWCVAALAGLAIFVSTESVAQPSHDEPWKQGAALLVIDPYELNAIDWRSVSSDKKVKAVIHRASIGARTDKAFVRRAAEAKRNGLLWGGYHLGLSGDPIAQADLLLSLAEQTQTTFLALDIEALGGNNMSLADAERFISKIHAETGRYPALYVNWTVYEAITREFDEASVFARSPLWIARFRKQLPALNGRVWSDYTLWQFASELNCPEALRKQRRSALCEPYRPYIVPGTKFDMDINIFNGDEAALTGLFGSTAP